MKGYHLVWETCCCSICFYSFEATSIPEKQCCNNILVPSMYNYSSFRAAGNREQMGGGWAKKGREGESKRSEIWQVRERQHDELLYWIYIGAVCAK